MPVVSIKYNRFTLKILPINKMSGDLLSYRKDREKNWGEPSDVFFHNPISLGRHEVFTVQKLDLPLQHYVL